MVALVLLPGLDGTGQLFRPLLEHLPPTIEPIVIGYPPEETMSYAALAELVLERLPTDTPFVLLGESFSGPVAVLAASRQPPGLLGLIFSASFVASPHHLPGFLALAAPVHLTARVLGPRLLMGRKRSKAMTAQMLAALGGVAGRVLRDRLRSAARIDVRAELAGLDLPSLYLRASDDAVLPRSAAEVYARTAARAKVEVVSAPHFLLQCAPQDAASSIREFVEACKSP